MCIYDKTRNGMSIHTEQIDMKILVKEYIVDSTAYVLQMREKVANSIEFDDQFRREGDSLDTKLLILLSDIRRIPWDGDILHEKDYMNYDGIDNEYVKQLQSLSDIIFHYYSDQSDYIEKQLTHAQRNEMMMPDHEWNSRRNAFLLRGINHHFQVYPDEIHTSHIQGLIHDSHGDYNAQCRMSDMLSKLASL